MTMNTIFDAASLTKVVATTASMMRLVEQGKVRLGDKVTVYLPQFQNGKSDITVRMLLTHFSGMRPDVDLVPEWSGYQTGVQRALIDKPVAAPGERFIYSDINFVLLGEIVRRISGKPLSEFAREEIFLPMGMTESQFNPPAELRSRIAPTELYPKMAAPLRGVVHDPTARYMNGVAGHAGLFTTAADLARFAQMLLGKGSSRSRRRRRTSRCCADWALTSIPSFRRTGGSCSRLAHSGIRVLRGPRSGWTRGRAGMWCC
jgi:CubicO group peptidase (beta-lactamase class C family)